MRTPILQYLFSIIPLWSNGILQFFMKIVRMSKIWISVHLSLIFSEVSTGNTLKFFLCSTSVGNFQIPRCDMGQSDFSIYMLSIRYGRFNYWFVIFGLNWLGIKPSSTPRLLMLFLALEDIIWLFYSLYWIALKQVCRGEKVNRLNVYLANKQILTRVSVCQACFISFGMLPQILTSQRISLSRRYKQLLYCQRVLIVSCSPQLAMFTIILYFWLTKPLPRTHLAQFH